MKLVFSPVAIEDLQRLYIFISERNPSSLKKAAKRLRQAFEILKEHPLIGYELDHLTGIRELLIPFGKGNYVIRYRAEKKRVSIAHLWHSREDREAKEA